MKKILFCILFSLFLLPCTFARTEFYDLDDNSSEKEFGISAGLRLSILGLEPTFAVNYRNFEAEAACAISSGVDGKSFGVAPSLSIGYCTNPFEKGSCTTFGLEYYLLSPSYTNLLSKVSENSTPLNISIHAVSLYYKGAVHFNKNFGLMWRLRLPLLLGGEGEFYNITSTQGALVCCLAGICTFAVGVNFTF